MNTNMCDERDDAGYGAFWGQNLKCVFRRNVHQGPQGAHIFRGKPHFCPGARGKPFGVEQCGAKTDEGKDQRTEDQLGAGPDG